MPRQKNKRFNELTTFSNTLQIPPNTNIQSINWQDRFGNDNPIILELGCGKGEYTIGLASHNPNNNHIGIDIKGDRLYIGAKEAEDKGMMNVNFVRTPIESINNIFEDNSISSIWVTFCDPQPNNPKKRLISPRFLKIYKKILKSNGTLYLKTDSDVLYVYFLTLLSYTKSKPNFEQETSVDRKTTDTTKAGITSQELDFLENLEVQVEFTNDLYNSEQNTQFHSIQTAFEKKYLALGKKIKLIVLTFVDNKN